MAGPVSHSQFKSLLGNGVFNSDGMLRNHSSQLFAHFHTIVGDMWRYLCSPSLAFTHPISFLIGSTGLLLDPSSPEIVSPTLTTLTDMRNMHWRRPKHVSLKDIQLISRCVDHCTFRLIILRQGIKIWSLDLLWVLWQNSYSTTMSIRSMPRYLIHPTHPTHLHQRRKVPLVRTTHLMCLLRDLWEPREWSPRERWLVRFGRC